MEPSDRAYVLHILDAIGEIEEYVAGMTWDDFLDDSKTQSAIVRQLEIIGEASKHLSESYRQSKPLPWKDIAGMRDKLIHHYFDVDMETVWVTATTDIVTMGDALRE